MVPTLAAPDSMRLTLSGIRMDEEVMPPSFKARMSKLASRICDQLEINSFSFIPADIQPDSVTIELPGGGFKTFSRALAPMPTTIFQQIVYGANRLWGYLWSRDVAENLHEFASIWESARDYGELVQSSVVNPTVEVNAGIIEEPESSYWSKIVSHNAPRMAIISDIASIFKNVMKALFGTKTAVASFLGYIGQAFGLISSTSNFKKAAAQKKYALEIGDTKGAVQSLALQISSVFGFVISGLGVASQVLKSLAFDRVVTVISKVFSYLVPISSLFSLIRSSYRLKVDEEFIEAFYEYAENPKLADPAKLKATLRFLLQKLLISEKEADGLSEDEVTKLYLCKKQALERTIGSAAVQKIINGDLSTLIRELEEQEPGAEERAEVLLAFVQQAADQTRFKDTLSVVIATISIITLVALHITTGGAPFAVYAIIAAINLLIDTGQIELINSMMVPISQRMGLGQYIPDLKRHRSFSSSREHRRPDLIDRVTTDYHLNRS